MGVYVFLQLSEVSDFAELAQQYKGRVVWVEDVASGSLGFLVDRSLFSCWENMVRLVVGRTLSSASR